jgi:hypothetical protein
MKKSKFGIGERWLCKRENSCKPDFYFVIIGKGDNLWDKLCRIDLVNPDIPNPERDGHGMEQMYSHLHLIKYATHVVI